LAGANVSGNEFGGGSRLWFLVGLHDEDGYRNGSCWSATGL
jgi:hypothetical protein